MTIASAQSDHSPIIIKILPRITIAKGKNYWKFNATLLKDSNYCNKLIQEINNAKVEHENLDLQSKWEIIKYKIRFFSIRY